MDDRLGQSRASKALAVASNLQVSVAEKRRQVTDTLAAGACSLDFLAGGDAVQHPEPVAKRQEQ